MIVNPRAERYLSSARSSRSLSASASFGKRSRNARFTHLSKPVGRGEFIIGKYLGLCVTLLFNLAPTAVGVTLALIWRRRRPRL